MNNAVLISINPKWCKLIASGEKSIEVRKTKPKLMPPFKCYIYQTLPKHGDWNDRDGRVIGEFVCDSIFPLSFYASDASFFDTEPPFPVPGTCLTDKEIAEYLGNGKTGYGWHISGLKIYAEPIPVTDFWRLDKCPYVSKNECTYPYHCFRAGQIKRCGVPIERPPQSWCYVEELE